MLKVSIIGLGQRGSSLLYNYFIKQRDIKLVYVCDSYPDRAESAAARIRAEKGDDVKFTTDYRNVLDSDTQAVVVSTSWETHLKIAIESLKAGKITAMEVGGAYNIEECWELVRAYEETKTPFMFMENCCYFKDELLALKMAREGIFGDIVHCSGSYQHDLRYEVSHGKELRHYRLDNYLKRNCENYPTHELGPIAKILDINRGNRITSLVSMSSKAMGLERYVNDNKDKINPELIGKRFCQGDVVDTLIKCAGGETIRLKLDTTLPGFYDRALTVKGTKGMYLQTGNMVIVDGIDNDECTEPADKLKACLNNASRYNNLLPDVWKNMTDADRASGHGGMDGIMLREFVKRAETGEDMPLDVYDAASWMAVSCLSEQSIALGSKPVEMPDFTNGAWIKRSRKDVF